MDFWKKARILAEETAKRTHELTKEAAKRSHDFTIDSSKFSNIVTETTKRSKEIAAEASKRADLMKIEALRRADKLKSFANKLHVASEEVSPFDLERYGITDNLREFVKEITFSTFRDFPLEDDSTICDVSTISNVRQDLTKWQEKHANLVLSNVKEISRLRYELCPRFMKERKFWRIYFILVNNISSVYEAKYNEEEKTRSVEGIQQPEEAMLSSIPSSTQKNSTPLSSIEQDLDVFLLGDNGDIDDLLDDRGDGDEDEDVLLDDDDFDPSSLK